MSDADRQFLQSMVPGLETTAEGRKLMIETAVEVIGRKGYRHVVGYIQKRLVPFWRQLGFYPRENREGFRFSDYDYVECYRELAARNDALSVWPEADLARAAQTLQELAAA